MRDPQFVCPTTIQQAFWPCLGISHPYLPVRGNHSPKCATCDPSSDLSSLTLTVTFESNNCSMKVLFDHHESFALTHGGFQTQIEQTKAALEQAGVQVGFLRWWDEAQKGDLIHFFGAAPAGYLHQARMKNIPVVMTNLFTATCNRSDRRLKMQGWVVRSILSAPFGEGIKHQLSWRSFSACERNIVGLEAERDVLELVYGISRNKVNIVPLGLSDVFINAGPGRRTEDFLVCVGTITERKNCVPLARLAAEAQVPLLFVGKPYAETDPYWKEFRQLIDGRCVRHQPHVGEPSAMVDLLHRARGAVIMSRYENWCLAAHEAAACGLPLLLPDQKWSRERFGDQATYFKGDSSDTAILRDFYQRCPSLPAPAVRLYRWAESAEQLRKVYEDVSSTSR